MPETNPTSEELTKRKAEAKRILEGEEWRQRRELREKIAAKRAAERENETLAQQAEAETIAQTRAETEAKAQAEAETKQKEFEKRVEKIETSKEKISSLKDKGISISPIRTLKSDLARVVKEDGVSISTIALSEQSRKRFGLGETTEPTKPLNHLFYLVPILFLTIAAGGIFLWWQLTQTDTNPITLPANTNNEQPLIFAESNAKVELAGEPQDIRDLVEAQEGTAEDSWTIKNITFIKSGITAPWNRVATDLKLSMPDLLTRSLASEYMFGLYRKGTLNRRFLILKASLPDQAYAGLSAWEATMGGQLFPLFYPSSPKLSANVFSDKLIRNKDIRVLSGSDNRSVLLYAFIDRDIILIAPDEETFLEVFSRFTNNQLD